MNKLIKKSTDIQAPKEKVWDVMLNDKYTRIWYATFNEGSHAVTDWKEGNKATFLDNDKNGIVGIITTHKPAEMLTIEYTGTVNKGKEDYESKLAMEFKGATETYRVSEKGGVTHLDVALDMSESYFDFMSAAWEKALVKVKELAESK